MAVTVTLSERLSAHLLAQADWVHLPVDALVEQLLTAALPLDELNGYPAPAADDTVPALAEVVARIKATPPNPAAVHPATKTAAELAADLLAAPPSADLLTFAELWPLWQAFEQELRRWIKQTPSAKGACRAMAGYLLDTNHLSPFVTLDHPLRQILIDRLQQGDTFGIAAPALTDNPIQSGVC